MSRRAASRSAGALFAMAFAAGCVAPSQVPTAPGDPCGALRPFAEGGERATLWVRDSAEFRAASEGIYRNALQALKRSLADTSWSAEPAQVGDLGGLPPAVVMDIDDTVLDNSEPQARMMLGRTCPGQFPAFWDDWVAERAAPAVPGAAGFIRAARALTDAAGRPVRIFFITNRECGKRRGGTAHCPQETDTLENLRALGLDAPTLAEDLMLRGERPEWAGEKLSRRLEVARGHRILMNIGDDLGDFLPEVRRQNLQQREQARCAHRDRWGERWFMIPNPMYGSWLTAVGPDLEARLAAPPELDPDCSAR